MFLPFARRTRANVPLAAPPSTNGTQGAASDQDGIAVDVPVPPPKAAARQTTPPPVPDEPDWYAILGVPETATQEQIAISYRRRAAATYSRRIGGERATRNLKLLNAAYEILGNPDRRFDYDQRRARWLAEHSLDTFPRPDRRDRRLFARRAPMDRPRLFSLHHEDGSVGALLILIVVGALVLAAFALSYKIRSFAPFSSLATHFGLVASSSPEVVGEPDTGLQPLSSSTPLKFATPAAKPASAEAATPTAEPDPFAGSAASVSNPTPAVGSPIQVKLKLVQNGTPIADVPVSAVAHFRTVDEHWPGGNRTVKTDKDGVATIEANIGNATRGYEVKVDVTATIDGAPHTWTTSFTPR